MLVDFKYLTTYDPFVYQIVDSTGYTLESNYLNYNYDETAYIRKLVHLRPYQGENIKIVWFHDENPCKDKSNDKSFDDFDDYTRLDDIRIYRRTNTFIPDQIYPQNQAINLKTAVPIKWSAPINAVNYDLQVSADSLFNYYNAYRNDIVDTTATISNLAYNTNYFWRVRAKNPVSESHWSEVWKFRTGKYSLNLPDTINLAINDSLLLDCRQYIQDVDSLNRELIVLGDFVYATVSDDYQVVIKPQNSWYGEEDLIFCLTNPDNKKAQLSKWTGSKYYSDYLTDTVKVIVHPSSGIEEDKLPLVTELQQNYPNPFNPMTTINFANSKEGLVRLRIYNIKGQFVKELQNSNLKPGRYSVRFDASALPSGMYIYRLEAPEKCFNKKMMLVK